MAISTVRVPNSTERVQHCESAGTALRECSTVRVPNSTERVQHCESAEQH